MAKKAKNLLRKSLVPELSDLTSQVNKFSFSDWVTSAQQFCIELPASFECEREGLLVYPKLIAGQIEQLSRALNASLPLALRQFFSEGCGGIDISYSWEPEEDEDANESLNRLFGKAEVWGGGEFCIATSLEEWHESGREWAREGWVAEYPEEKAKWSHSLPIMELANGDYLALDCRIVCDDPPLLYLSHDDYSQTISCHFTDFLTDWAGVCYVGPEIWMLKPFLSEKGLDATHSSASNLRKLLRRRNSNSPLA